MYVDTIRGVQPSGPYHLLGYSFGGNVVAAMAAQLVRYRRDSGVRRSDRYSSTGRSCTITVATMPTTEIWPPPCHPRSSLRHRDWVDAVRAGFDATRLLVASSTDHKPTTRPVTLITADAEASGPAAGRSLAQSPRGPGHGSTPSAVRPRRIGDPSRVEAAIAPLLDSHLSKRTAT